MSSLPKIWDAFPDLEAPLQRVVAQLHDTWQLDFPEIQQTVEAQLFAGKLVRPALTLLFSQLKDDEVSEQAVKLASVVELLHYATLVHDDVIDDSDARRGVASVQSAVGKDTAVYTGDYLFVLLFELLNEVGDQDINATAINSLRTILVGELHQKANRFDTAMTMDRYFEQIQGKTAALFQLATYFGAKTADVTANVVQLAEQIGYHLGVAFQLMDDYLDFVSEEDILGKPANQDVFNGIYTAPMIMALQSQNAHSQAISAQLQNPAFDHAAYQTVKTHIEASGALDELKTMIEVHSQKTRTLITELPAGIVQDQLLQVTDMLLARSY